MGSSIGNSSATGCTISRVSSFFTSGLADITLGSISAAESLRITKVHPTVLFHVFRRIIVSSGRNSPYPTIDIRLFEIWCFSTRYMAVFMARSVDRCKFDGNRAAWMGALSVWPSAFSCSSGGFLGIGACSPTVDTPQSVAINAPAMW